MESIHNIEHGDEILWGDRQVPLEVVKVERWKCPGPCGGNLTETTLILESGRGDMHTREINQLADGPIMLGDREIIPRKKSY